MINPSRTSKLARARMRGAARGVVIAGIAVAAAVISAVVVFLPGDPQLACHPEIAANSSSPSPADEVFCYELSATETEILVDFVLDPSGYLYRDKFDFAVSDPRIELQTASFPVGKMHSDDWFGDQEIYRDQFRIAVPYTSSAPAGEFEFILSLQGCDDVVGLCYPPQDWASNVALPAGSAPAATAGATAATTPAANSPTANSAADSSLFESIQGSQSDESLPVDEAFSGNVRFDSANELTVSWQIEPGYYLYRDSFSVEIEGDIQAGTLRLPAGVAHVDQNFGDTEVYYNFVEFVAPFARAHPDEQQVTIRAGFQGCRDESICYPPSEQLFSLTLPASAEFASSANVAASASSGSAPPPMMVSEQDRFANLITGDSWFAFLGAFYAAGLLLSFTPCVLPMVPILSSIIAGQGGTVSAQRGFMLSLTYVLGMAFTYTVAGAIAAMAGAQVQAIFQQPWILGLFAALFVVMALGMFGLFEIQMPSAVQSRITNMANRQKGGTFVGTAIIGALTALVVTTCVAPPLIGALAVIGQSGDVVRGASALFILSIGMGTPLLLVGASAGKVLPKVGPWMNVIKAGFGIIMIGMAIWMLERVLPGSITLLLWALLVFFTGVFLGAFESLPANPHPSRRIAKGFGVLACVYGAMLLLGSRLGGESVINPIPLSGGFMGQQATAHEELAFVNVATVSQLDGLLAQAQQSGQPVMIDFTAEWCISCKEMEAFTFPDPSVVAALEPYMVLQADVTENDADDKALLDYYGIIGPPTIIFYDRSGNNLDDYGYTLAGYSPADEFAAHVSTVEAL